jgi:inner membrane protein involved in colicin E2 resistance
MAVYYFPEALNQGHATIAEVLRGQALILFLCAFVGFLGYTLAMIVLGFFTAFVRHLPFRVMHKASMTVGIAFAALIQLYRIPFLLYRPSDLAAVIGIALAFLALAFGIGIAVRIVRCNAPSPVAH